MWGGRFNKCAVLSELKKACSRARDSIRPSRDRCRLIQLAPPHPRSLCNLISSRWFPSPLPPSISLLLPSSSHSPPITDLGALRVIFSRSAGDGSGDADANGGQICSWPNADSTPGETENGTLSRSASAICLHVPLLVRRGAIYTHFLRPSLWR